MNVQNLLPEVMALSKSAGEFAFLEQTKLKQEQVDIKSLNSLVTYVDKQIEKEIIQKLSHLIPEASFLAEENTVAYKEAEYTWIIDPLDGTTNYIHGIPFYSVSIALKYKSESLLGVIYEPTRDECFSAIKGGGCFLNGQRVNVSNQPYLADSLLATGFPYYMFDRMDNYLGLLKQLMEKSRGIRRIGSAALDLAYVACGRFEGFYEYGLNDWDVAAGALLVEEAGGKVSDFDGTPDFFQNQTILATNSYIYSELKEEIRRFF